VSFTSPEFPGRTFSSTEELEISVREKNRIKKELDKKDTIFTVVETNTISIMNDS
jgi:hypothetical protein